MPKPLRADGAETRALLKQQAQRLFAKRGLDGVTIQDIVTAAGQRNSASLRYYFGSKEALIKELIVDGARLIDEERQAMLNKMESDGSVTLRNVLYALIEPMLNLGLKTGEPSYIRMIANLQLNHRRLLRDALDDQWNLGYRRCLAHLRAILNNLPAELLDQRLSLVGIYGNAALAAWEANQDAGDGDRLWATESALPSLVDSFESMLMARPSKGTISMLTAPPVRKRKGTK